MAAKNIQKRSICFYRAKYQFRRRVLEKKKTLNVDVVCRTAIMCNINVVSEIAHGFRVQVA